MESTDRGPAQALAGWAVADGVPDELALVYDFANTLDERVFGGYERFEAFDRPAALGRWLAHRGLIGRRAAVSSEDLALAHELRAHLRAAARAHVDGADGHLDRAAEDRADELVDREAEPPPGRFATLVGRLPLVAELRPGGGLGLRPAGAGVPGALARILAGAVVADGLGTWARLKMCLAPDCRWVFYDHCKPRTGRWCSTTGCGNRMKTRAYRARVRG